MTAAPVRAAPAARRGLPPVALPALVFVLWLLVVPLVFGHRLLNSDGDLARHLRHGETMLAQRGLIHADAFSFTMAGREFLGFEYGSQVLLALAHRAGGLAGVTVLAGLLVAFTYAWIARLLLRRGVEPALAALATMTAAVLGAMHWSARPHLFTFVGIVLLLDLLENRRRAWLAVPLFALWANIHGGFVYGFVLCGMYVAGAAAARLLDRPRGAWAEARHPLLVLGLALPSALLTPHGTALYGHLRRFFATPDLFALTTEFHSPDFHTANGKVFLGVLLLVVLALAFSREQPTWTQLAVLCGNLAFALLAQRNIPLFGLTALPLLAVHLDREWRRVPALAGVRERAAEDAARGTTWPWVLPAAAAMLALGAAGGRLGGVRLLQSRFDPAVFPAALVGEARAAGVEGRLLSEFTWSGYVLYAWPEQRVFVDPGSDFYGPALLREYATMFEARPGWRELLERWRIENVLVPAEAPIARELGRDPEWRVWGRDRSGVLLRRGVR